MTLIDCHAHLDLVADLPAALERARQSGVVGIVAQGRDRRSGEHALGLAARYPGFVYTALGLHPYRLASPRLVSRLEAELRFVEENLHRAVALGEVGWTTSTTMGTRGGSYSRRSSAACAAGPPVWASRSWSTAGRPGKTALG